MENRPTAAQFTFTSISLGGRCRGMGLAAALVALLVSAASAQTRTAGAAHLFVNMSGVSSSLAVKGAEITWKSCDPNYPVVLATAAVPFDVPGGIVCVGPDRAICSGWSSSANEGRLARLEFALGPSPSISVVEWVSTGSVDPYELNINAQDGVLYAFDIMTSKLYTKNWGYGTWGSLGSLSMIADLSALTPKPVIMRSARPGESPTGVYLDSSFVAFQLNNHKVLHVVPAGGSWVVADVTPVAAAPVTPGISIRDELTVSHEGPVDVKIATGGNFIFERLVDGFPVMSGTLPPSANWQSIPIPPGALEVGKAYRLIGSGLSPTSEFYPSSRWGSAQTLGDYAMGKGYFRAQTMRVGNDEFSVWGRIQWNGASAPPTEDVPVFLAIAIENPGVSPVVTLPSGQVVLDPVAGSLFGEDWTPMAAQPEFCQLTATLPIDAEPGFEGLGLLFQWIAFDAGGSFFVSDVFGGRIAGVGGIPTSPGSLAATSNVGGGQGNSGGNQGPSLAQRRSRAIQWIKRCSNPQAMQRVRSAIGSTQQ